MIHGSIYALYLHALRSLIESLVTLAKQIPFSSRRQYKEFQQNMQKLRPPEASPTKTLRRGIFLSDAGRRSLKILLKDQTMPAMLLEPTTLRCSIVLASDKALS